MFNILARVSVGRVSEGPVRARVPDPSPDSDQQDSAGYLNHELAEAEEAIRFQDAASKERTARKREAVCLFEDMRTFPGVESAN